MLKQVRFHGSGQHLKDELHVKKGEDRAGLDVNPALNNKDSAKMSAIQASYFHYYAP
jgi:hypothetical protein